MAPLSSIITGLSLASVALCSPLSSQLSLRATNATTPCAQVGALTAEQKNTQRPRVPAQLAYDCITSVPFNQSAAVALVDSLTPYFRWQSTTTWLADPPKKYTEKVQPAIDIQARLKQVRDKAVAGQYENEYEFGTDLYKITQDAHDAHLYYIPDSVGTVFNWGRPVPLVSVSSDGQELPQPYVYEDVLQESLGKNTWTPSHVTQINDQDAVKFLEDWAQVGEFQDRDALWNGLFYELAPLSVGLRTVGGNGRFAGAGKARYSYPGASTKLTFANGTSRTYENYAEVLVPFQGVTDGKVLYQFFFTQNGRPTSPTGSSNSTSPLPSTSPSNSTSPLSPTLPSATPTPTSVRPASAPGYPPPVFRSSPNYIGGYYLEREYSDVAVLSVVAFLKQDFSKDEFSGPAAKFLADAKQAGKKKLVIDVSGNIGGILLQGYDLFKILFPKNIDHAAASRYLATESTKLLTQTISDASEGISSKYDPTNQTLFDLQSNIASSPFNYLINRDVDSKPFQNWEQQFGPVEVKGVKYSNLTRWDLSSPIAPMLGFGDFIHGYGPLANYTEQPFAPEDVVVVTDSGCTSTCHTFTDLVHQRAGVKLVAMGGRPQPGLTQALGSVKGAQAFGWSDIQSLAQMAITNLTSPEESARLKETELGEYLDNTPFLRAATGTNGGGVNFRDAIRDGDETQTPLQFIYEPADCRILYTKSMTVDVTAIWKAVADSVWGTKNHCIAGKAGGGNATGDFTREGVIGFSPIGARELSVSERAHSKRMEDWRAQLKVEDYPLDDIPYVGHGPPQHHNMPYNVLP